MSDLLQTPAATDARPADALPALTCAHAEAGARAAGARERWRQKWSWRLSRWLHGLVIGAIAAELLAGVPLSPLIADRPPGEQIELTAVQEPREPPAALARLAVLADNRPAAREIAAAEIERLTHEAIPPELAAELLADTPPAAAASAWLQQRMLDEIAAAEQLSTDDQHRRLANLGQQLERISSAESVDAASARLASLLQTGQRATQPAAEPIAGEFDLDSAQLHDVKRTEKTNGGYDYVAVLLDSAGRTMESSLTEAEGAKLYRTFEIMKANPLLERVYRGVVMSLLDKLMRGGAAPATPRASLPLP